MSTSSDTPTPVPSGATAASGWHAQLPSRVRARPRAYGTGRYGTTKYDDRDDTRYAWTRVVPAVAALALAFLALAAPARAQVCENADSLTTNYQLCKPSVDVEGAIPWGAKWNANADIVDSDLAVIAQSTSAFAPLISALGVSTAANAANLVAESTKVAADTTTLAGLKASTGTCTLPNFPITLNTGGVVCQQPSNVTGNSATTTALAAAPTKCSAGNYPLGIDVNGNAQSCTSAGVGDVVKASTQTLSGLNTFAGGVVVSSGIYGVGLRDQFRNLSSSPTAAFPLTSINIAADEALLENAASYLLYAQGVNVTITTGTAGLNGLDTGSPAASTWYYSWVISNGSTLGGLISLSSATPTMPSGYIYKALAGAIQLDGSKQVIAYRQFGKRVSTANVSILSAAAGVTSFTQVSIAAAVPANVVSAVRGLIGNNGSAERYSAIATDAAGMSEVQCQGPTGTLFDGIVGCGFYINAYLSQTLYWKAQDTLSIYSLEVNGFDLK